MLDRAKVLQQLQAKEQELFIDYAQEREQARIAWQQLCKNPHALSLAYAAQATGVPLWTDELDTITHIIVPPNYAYNLVCVDGSQIYPDRHQGIGCYMINIGTVVFSYNASSSVNFFSEPHIFVPDDTYGDVSRIDVVNAQRHAFELRKSLELAITLPSEQRVILLDGSLIFWHLEKDQQLKQLFLAEYLELLNAMYEAKIPCAGYISLPKSKELVSLLRLNNSSQPYLDCIVDTTIASGMLQPNDHTTLFKSNASASRDFPEHLRPHFVYVHVGDEVARVELPAWVAHDKQHYTHVMQVVIDQATKGDGYPIGLAEAHEQAVVKGADRDFFYQCLQTLSIARKRRIRASQKSTKKRWMSI